MQRFWSAGSAPLSSAAARVAQPASVIWVLPRLSSLSFASPPVGGGGAPAGGGGATRLRGQLPQGRREGHQPRVADGGVDQTEDLEPRQGASAQGGGERRGADVTHMHANEMKRGHGRQRARAQPLRQPLHAVGAGCWLDYDQHHERWQHRAQRAQERQVCRGEAFVETVDLLRLAQLLAAPYAHLEAQRCGRLMISPQLGQQRLRRRPQLFADAAQGHGNARLEHVAQPVEEDARLVTAQLRQRHPPARAVAWAISADRFDFLVESSI
eukprot:scaffold31266_cov60-Phaeocystis_antarctica.AAC.1